MMTEQEYQAALARAKALLKELEDYPKWKPKQYPEEDTKIWRRMWAAHLEGDW